jgi:hypothetical protein
MHFRTLVTVLFFTLGGLAQEVDIISPTPNTRIIAGQPFTSTVKFAGESRLVPHKTLLHVSTADTTSSVDVIALFFGAKGNEPPNDDLGQTKLSIVNQPSFDSRLELNVQLTIPIDIINGLNRTYNLTCGEFFTLGVSHIQNKVVRRYHPNIINCETGRKYALDFRFPGTGVRCLALTVRIK